MKLKIAGYNIDSEVIKLAIEKGVDKELFTPEILSAAYARISRSPLTVEELRKEARSNVPKARKSNKAIVFDMGHASIAEHAVFNLDIENISRFALEEFERHRLASYTEKSQRYIEVGKDFIIPQEFKSSGHEEELIQLQKASSDLYFSLIEAGMDKEDARYYLPLSLTGQVGVTINTRTAEHMILAMAASPLKEVNQLSELMNLEIKKVAPSLVRYIEPSTFHKNEYSTGLSPREDIEEDELTGDKVLSHGKVMGSTELLLFPSNIDERVLAIRLQRKRSIPFSRALKMVNTLNEEVKIREMAELFKHMELHDTAPNDLEHFFLTWEIVLSGAAFAQLKRHRLVGMSYSPYSPTLGFTHPPSLPQDQALLKKVDDLINKSHELFTKLAPHPAAQYALLSGHRRRLIWSSNLRELFHFSRLREDEHAQWDIRLFASQMRETIKKTAPLTTALLCGKDAFPKVKSDYLESLN
jgi:flavin-dependent thymidylate synthase